MDDETPTEAVLTAVADREDVEPTELDEPLYDAVDTEALDALFRNTWGAVTFGYLGYEVTVTHDASVEVTPLDAE